MSFFKPESLLELVMMIVIIVGAVCLIGLLPAAYINSKSSASITVTDKERITEQKNSYYLVYGADKTYSIKDSFLFWRFNSSDLYGRLERGKTYECEVVGFRLPFFSTYQNILSCKGVNV